MPKAKITNKFILPPSPFLCNIKLTNLLQNSLEISNKKTMGKLTKTWKLNNTQLNSHWVKEKIKREIRKYLNTNKINLQHTNIYGIH